MKNKLIIASALALLAGTPVAHAATSSYNVTATWFEPMTQPRDSIFKGTFDYDAATHTVTNLKGLLSESMSGSDASNMNWLSLNNQLVSWYDASLGGTFAAAFKNTTTATFLGGTWAPEDGVAVGGVYSGFPRPANNPENAYALIFVPNNPLSPLNQAQLDKIAYADFVKNSPADATHEAGYFYGGMMGAVGMTGTSEAGYGALGTMYGYPVAQSITAAVPEPETYAMFLVGLGLIGGIARRRRAAV